MLLFMDGMLWFSVSIATVMLSVMVGPACTAATLTSGVQFVRINRAALESEVWP